MKSTRQRSHGTWETSRTSSDKGRLAIHQPSGRRTAAGNLEGTQSAIKKRKHFSQGFCAAVFINREQVLRAEPPRLQVPPL